MFNCSGKSLLYEEKLGNRGHRVVSVTRSILIVTLLSQCRSRRDVRGTSNTNVQVVKKNSGREEGWNNGVKGEHQLQKTFVTNKILFLHFFSIFLF